jgi:hypothetical protein
MREAPVRVARMKFVAAEMPHVPCALNKLDHSVKANGNG